MSTMLVITNSPSDRFRGVVRSYIERRRHELASSHPAIDQALEPSYDACYQTSTSQPQRRLSFTSVVNSVRQQNVASQDKPTDLLKIYRPVDEERQIFKRALQDFERNAPKKTKIVLVTDSSQHTWAEVIKAVESVADERYKVKGFGTKIARSIAKFMMKNAETLTSWQELLPAGSEYFSLICGGLKLIFGAAAVLGDVSEDICAALEIIPEAVSRADTITLLFEQKGLPADSKLHTRSAVLLASIFALMNRIVIELRKNFFKREVMALLKQERYAQSLRDAITKVKDNIDRFETTVRDYITAMTIDTHARGKEIQKQTQRIESTVITSQHENRQMQIRLEKRVQDCYQDQSQQLLMIQDTQYQVQQGLMGMSGDLTSVVKAVQSTVEPDQLRAIVSDILKAEMRNVLLPCLLASNSRVDYANGQVRLHEQEIHRLKLQNLAFQDKQKAVEYTDDTLYRLDFDDLTTERDLRAVLYRGLNMTYKQQDRAIAILSSHVFQAWVAMESSAVLSVNANSSEASDYAPSSYVSAKLVDAIMPATSDDKPKQTTTLCLSFFCAEHTASNDRDSGPAGMMRNLISQLLTQYLDFRLDTLRQLEQIDPDDALQMVSSLELLLMELPADLVTFCIIDAVAAFEDRSLYAVETAIVVAQLIQFVDPVKAFTTRFKLLFADPSYTRSLRDNLDDQEMLVIDELIPTTDGLMQTTVVDKLRAEDTRGTSIPDTTRQVY